MSSGSHSNDSSTLVREWAALTTESWARQAKNDWKRQLNGQRMVRVRASKKLLMQQLRDERSRLEHVVSNRVASLRSVAAREDAGRSDRMDAVYRLSLECGMLRDENVKLRDQLQQHEGFLSKSHQALVEINSLSEHDGAPQTIKEASKKSQWVARACQKEDGWRVCFSRGEPSFYFHPFTSQEFDATINAYDKYLSADVSRAGRLFCWTVHHTPSVRRASDNGVIARARFSTRIRCSLNQLDHIVTSSDIDAWPLLTTPPNWRNDQRRDVSTLVLQQLDSNSHVMICNLPGPVHTRFFQFTRRQLTVDDATGNRVLKFVAVAADSAANARSRSAEDLASVHWVTEGGHSIVFTEADETTIDIEYDHWAVCESELHARHLYVRWAHYVTTCYWSQLLVSPELIKSK